MVGKVGGMISNLLRSTVSRSENFMVRLWIAHVRPLIDYCSCMWNTGYIGDMRTVESLQRRWTREIEGMSSLEYGERLRRVGLFSVKGRLLRLDLIKVWKSFNALVDVGMKSLFVRSSDNRTRGHACKLVVPRCHSEARRRYFAVRVVRHWNELPADVVMKSSLDSFKAALAECLGDRLFDCYAVVFFLCFFFWF